MNTFSGGMSNNILGEIRESFRKGSALTRLIYINLGVFVLVKVAFLIYFLVVPSQNALFSASKAQAFKQEYLQYLMVSSKLDVLIYRPWTIITYMFLHFDFLHILFNMLMLFWFGSIFLRYLNEKQLYSTYFSGGLFGAALYLITYNIFPGLSTGIMLGASASVTAIVIGISFYNPNYVIRLFFIGEVKLKYIAIAYIVLDVLQIAGDNPGGHIAHLGGALYGYLFATQLKKGKDIGRGMSNFMDAFFAAFKRKPKMKVTYKNQARNMTDQDYNKEKAATQKEVDAILDKIAKSGYNSLTKQEKETLFKMSNKG